VRWAQTGEKWHSRPTWHLTATPEGTGRASAQCEVGLTIRQPKYLPADRRPALARNNVCARCKKAYLKTRPDLLGYVNRLNDTRDV